MINSQRDSLKYCAFHKEIGHITEECRILKDKIYKLIQNNYLKEFMSCHKER